MVRDKELKMEDDQTSYILGGGLSQGQGFGGEKKTMDLCACEIEEREHGVGAGVNDTLM